MKSVDDLITYSINSVEIKNNIKFQPNRTLSVILSFMDFNTIIMINEETVYP